VAPFCARTEAERSRTKNRKKIFFMGHLFSKNEIRN